MRLGLRLGLRLHERLGLQLHERHARRRGTARRVAARLGAIGRVGSA
jgi:hypothetical protein